MNMRTIKKQGRLVFIVFGKDVREERKKNRSHFEATVRRFERARANVSCFLDRRMIR